MPKKRFTALIQSAGARGGAYVEIPFDVEKVYGTRGRLPVRATFDGHGYRGSIAKMSGCHMLGVKKDIRAAIGKDIGDQITVVVERDRDERTVSVPDDFAKARRGNGNGPESGNRPRVGGSLGLMNALAIAILLVVPLAAQDSAPKHAGGKQLARLHGKGYRMLLAQYPVKGAARQLGDFRENGRKRPEGLVLATAPPAGHWVWVRPFWFVYRDRIGVDARRSGGWSPEQATGAPDVKKAGDDKRAWASMAADSHGGEWLLLEYEKPVLAVKIQIHENYNPGAVERVTVFDVHGRETQVYRNATPKAAGKFRVFEIPLVPGQRTMRVKVYLATGKVKSWNEIDAVGLVDRDGRTRWAESAHASSWYKVGQQVVVRPPIVIQGQRIRFQPAQTAEQKRIAKLEREVAKLRAMLEELRARLRAIEGKGKGK